MHQVLLPLLHNIVFDASQAVHIIQERQLQLLSNPTKHYVSTPGCLNRQPNIKKHNERRNNQKKQNGKYSVTCHIWLTSSGRFDNAPDIP